MKHCNTGKCLALVRHSEEISLLLAELLFEWSTFTWCRSKFCVPRMVSL